METVINEHNQLIATRVPPGDRWKLVDDSKRQVYPSLTETLEAYLHKTGFDVRINAIQKAKSHKDWKDYKDDGDLYMYKTFL